MKTVVVAPTGGPELEHRDTDTPEGVPDCWCLPTVEYIANAKVEGGYVRLIVHNDPKAKGGGGA